MEYWTRLTPLRLKIASLHNDLMLDERHVSLELGAQKAERGAHAQEVQLDSELCDLKVEGCTHA
jgi:hypothetical protein